MAQDVVRGSAGLLPAARVTLLLITPLSALAFAGLGPVLPQIGAHFAAVPNSAFLVRLLLTCIGGTMAVGAPIAGFLGDRFGQRGVLLAALLLYAVLGVLGYFIDDLPLLLVSRLMLGFAQTVVGVMPVTIIVSWMVGVERDKWIGLTSMSGTIGGLVLIGLAGVVGQHDWRNVFLLYLVALPALALALATLPVGRPAFQAESAAQPARFGGWLQLVLLGLVCGAVVMGVGIFLPFRLAEIGVTSPEQVAIALLPPTITGTITAFAYGYARRSLSIPAIFAIAFVVCAIALATEASLPHFPIIVAAQAVFGIGMGFLAPSLFATAGNFGTQATRARMMGYANAGFFGGPLLAQLPLEVLARSWGPGLPILGLAGLAAVAAVVALLAVARAKPQTTPQFAVR